MASFDGISAFNAAIPVACISGLIDAGSTMMGNSISSEGHHSSDLYMRDFSKTDVIAVAIVRQRILQIDTMGFGDGKNERNKFAYAGIGVAIDGSYPSF